MKNRRASLWLSGSLYGVSLLLPPFVFEEGNFGFLLGFVCLLFGFEHLAWLANPLYFASLVTMALWKRTGIPAVLSGVALILALTTVRIAQLPRNEAGQMTDVVGYGPAFYLWLASMVVILVSAARELRTPEPSRAPMDVSRQPPPIPVGGESFPRPGVK